MSSVRDQTEEVKLAQFKKFYPEVYSAVSQTLHGVGVKTDRKIVVNEDKSDKKLMERSFSAGSELGLRRHMSKIFGENLLNTV